MLSRYRSCLPRSERAIDVVCPVSIRLAGVSGDQVYDLDIVGVVLISLAARVAPTPASWRVGSVSEVIGPVVHPAGCRCRQSYPQT